MTHTWVCYWRGCCQAGPPSPEVGGQEIRTEHKDWAPVGGEPRVRSLFVSLAFPLISLSNELERQLGTRSLPRDPGPLEPEHRGHQGQEGGPGLPSEQGTGLQSQARPGPVGDSWAARAEGVPGSAPPQRTPRSAGNRCCCASSSPQGAFLLVGRASGQQTEHKGPGSANCCKAEVSSLHSDGAFVRSCWWKPAGQRPPSWALESPGRLAAHPVCVHTRLQQKCKRQGRPFDLVCTWGHFTLGLTGSC